MYPSDPCLSFPGEHKGTFCSVVPVIRLQKDTDFCDFIAQSISVNGTLVRNGQSQADPRLTESESACYEDPR